MFGWQTFLDPSEVDFSEFAEHPLYGSKPRHTGLDIKLLRPLRLGSAKQEYFIQTAVLADIDKLCAGHWYSFVPCDSYVDFPETCVDCGRKFIFFADEQKYWYEELGFRVDARAVRCHSCRKETRRVKQLHAIWGQLIAKDRTNDEREQLVEVGLELAAVGELKSQGQEKLRAETNKLRALGHGFMPLS